MVNNLRGQHQSKSSTPKKVLPIHQNDVQNVGQKRKLEWGIITMVVKGNPLKSLVLNVVRKIPFHSSQKEIDQFYAATVLKNTEQHNNKKKMLRMSSHTRTSFFVGK